eukprot:CAMPEP_0172837498 /NCGR_PEP_ID=MMETSP1075-20121228/27239_1 /TAXON_ID=2916 /ORGANISM="Ceratium fusus, Strain PA161109" /LENGTH=48 /DNA_ID= /DNA_START= /DNA_END= /DNA_ORIENTATION=
MSSSDNPNADTPWVNSAIEEATLSSVGSSATSAMTPSNKENWWLNGSI